MIFRYVLRELRAHRKYTALFLVNLSLGLLGLAAIEGFKSGIQTELEATSQALAGGDLVVSSRMPIPEAELKRVLDLLKERNVPYEMGKSEELFSMASLPSSSKSRLVQLRAQDPMLPFYGAIELGEKGTYRGGSPSDLESGANLWVYPEILTQFGIQKGDTIQIGGHPFHISAVVTQDAAAPIGRGSLAPRVYLSRAALQKTGLIQKGSTVFHQFVFRLSPPEIAPDIEKLARARIEDPSITIHSHQSASEANSRLVRILDDYLGLVALIALLLSNIGTIYLFRAHLTDRLRDFAILKMVGLESGRIFQMGFTQAWILGLTGSLLALCSSLLLFPLVTEITKPLLSFSIPARLHFEAVAVVVGVGVLGTLLCVWPLLRKVRRLNPRELFQEGSGLSLKLSTSDWPAWIPYLLFFSLMCVRQANSFQIAGLFLCLVALSAALLMGIGWLGLRLLGKLAERHSSFEHRYAWRELSRRPAETLSAFVALALGGLLSPLIFNIEASLRSEFELGAEKDRPALFLFDIQEEQISGLCALASEIGHPLQGASPIVRGRLITLNGAPYRREEKSSLRTQEEESTERGQAWGFNLTERETLSSSEEVVSGRYFEGPYDPASGNPIEVSLEERFAKRMGFSVGDEMGFEILGVPIEAKVVGLRRVRWTSFQPNFFVQFQGGALAEAPKTYLSSIGPLTPEERVQVQSRIVEQFPNVSILDVTRTVENILELATRMTWALKWMAALVLVAAICVVLSIQSFHLQRNAGERDLLVRAGFTRTRIHRLERISAWTLTSAALLLGFILSFVTAWPLTEMIFRRAPSLSLGSALILLIALPALLSRRRWLGRAR